jgi:hypothetical protein
MRVTMTVTSADAVAYIRSNKGTTPAGLEVELESFDAHDVKLTLTVAWNQRDRYPIGKRLVMTLEDES